jgi:hypothetical protein
MANQKSTTLPPIDHSTIGQFNWTNNSTVPTSVITDTMAGSITGGTTVGNAGTYFGSNVSYGAAGLAWANASNTVTLSPIAATINSGGTIDLKGESADIIIDGMSLKATLEALHERLNWMQPNTKLETEWDQLRELGDRYRELEKQCKEKTQMWTKLRTVSKTNQS